MKAKDQIFTVAAQLSGLARDMTNREALKKALLPPESLHGMVERTLAEMSPSSNIYALRLEQRRLRQEKEVDKQRELRPEVMVPWVHWPGHSETGNRSPDPCYSVKMPAENLLGQVAATTTEARKHDTCLESLAVHRMLGCVLIADPAGLTAGCELA